MKSLLLLLILPVVLCVEKEWVCDLVRQLLGGKFAEEGEFPGVVYLNVSKSAGNDSNIVHYDCAGSLIKDHWVLTAAHCVSPQPPQQFHSVRVYPAKGHSDSIESRKVIALSGHPYPDDIALIWLPQPMSSIHPNFKTVSLPLQGQNLTSKEITLVGWGTTEEELPSKLMKMEHLLLNQTICHFIPVNETEALCHFNSDRPGSNCQGDSGGPVFMDGLQVGVVSGEQPDHYFSPYTLKDTRVSGYRDWIDQQTAEKLSGL